MRKCILVLLFICMGFVPGVAQDYLYEAGIGAGVSSAYGDLNQGGFFYSPRFEFDAHFRYKYNLRWAFTAEFLSAGLAGKSSDFDNQFPNGAAYAFNNRLWQVSGNAEFNFLNYGIGASYRDMSRISPFLSVGMGLGMVSGGPKNEFSFSLPLGAGVKYRFAPRWNLMLKLVFAKTFTDRADGVEDPYAIESSGAKNTDWYSTLGMSISYEFGLRKRKCNNLD
ncbi:MAG: DUF6089 family protein [Bacteroidales bacterium]